MKKPIKAFAVSGATTSTNWLPSTLCFQIEKSDVVVFPGGADVNPLVYGEMLHPNTRMDMQLDIDQIAVFNEARKFNKPLVGICRGAQLLCALAGGKLVQHQRNGEAYHRVYTYDGECVEASSDHHQAMYPWHMKSSDFKVLGWAFGQSDFHQGGKVEEMVIGEAPLDMEVEIAFFPHINALCIQAHPEWQYPCRNVNLWQMHACVYYAKLFERFMDGDKFLDAHKSFCRTEELATKT